MKASMTLQAATIGVVALLASVTPVLAQQADGCSAPPLAIDVTPIASPTATVDDSLSREEIRARRMARGALQASELTFGYYEASAGHKYEAELVTHGLASGNVCLAVKELRVRFGIEERRILVARGLSSAACLRNHVTGHERRHAAADDALVARFLPRVRTYLANAWPEGLGVEARDEDDGTVALRGRIEERLAEIRSQFANERNAAQDVIDAEDFVEQHLPPACREEMRRLLSSPVK